MFVPYERVWELMFGMSKNEDDKEGYSSTKFGLKTYYSDGIVEDVLK